MYEIGFLPTCSLPAIHPFRFHFLFLLPPPRPTRLFPTGRRLPSDALPTDPAGLGWPVFGRVSPCELATLMPCHRGGAVSSLRRSSPFVRAWLRPAWERRRWRRGLLLGGGRVDGGQGSEGRRRLSFFFWRPYELPMTGRTEVTSSLLNENLPAGWSMDSTLLSRLLRQAQRRMLGCWCCCCCCWTAIVLRWSDDHNDRPFSVAKADHRPRRVYNNCPVILTFTYLYLLIHIHVYMYIHMHVCAYMYTYTCIYRLTYMNIWIYMHMQIMHIMYEYRFIYYVFVYYYVHRYIIFCSKETWAVFLQLICRSFND